MPQLGVKLTATGHQSNTRRVVSVDATSGKIVLVNLLHVVHDKLSRYPATEPDAYDISGANLAQSEECGRPGIGVHMTHHYDRAALVRRLPPTDLIWVAWHDQLSVCGQVQPFQRCVQTDTANRNGLGSRDTEGKLSRTRRYWLARASRARNWCAPKTFREGRPARE